MSSQVTDSPAAPAPFIRLYGPSDEADFMEICRITAHALFQVEPIRTLIPYIFALPYIRIHPEWCWVVDNGLGKAVGYIDAVPDSKEYLRRVKAEYLPYFKNEILPKLERRFPGAWTLPEGMNEADIKTADECEGVEAKTYALLKRFWNPDHSILHSCWPQLVEEYPCHIHIDILPEYQGKGLGRLLMQKLVEKLRAEGVEGIHLMKAGDTEGSERFYEKVGFARWQVDMGGSETGELGVKPGGGGVHGYECLEWRCATQGRSNEVGEQ